MPIIGNGLANAPSRIMKDGRFASDDLERIFRILENRLEVHKAELLSPMFGKEGKTINVARHNGIEEIGH